MSYQSIVVLTGAGISAESGIATFRASDGLWENHRIEDVASPEGFQRDPELVQNFYNLRREQLLSNEVAANAAHIALSKLEQVFAGKFLLVTQNIDDLHERAGSKQIIHMHGELLKMRCQQTQQLFECKQAISVDDKCLCCNQAGNLRPHIVWFGEMPLLMDEITTQLIHCDLFVAIGTSGNVYPAAGFVEIARQSGAKTLEINLDSTEKSSAFDERLVGKAGEVVPEWVVEILQD